MQPISFLINRQRVNGKFFPAEKPKDIAFLLLQGWQGHQNTIAAQALADLGYSAMTYDMRGNGESEGDSSIQSAAEYLGDAIIAYDFLKERVGGQAAISVVGSSFGGYIGTLLSEVRPVVCISLRVPANYPDTKFHHTVTEQVDTEELADWRLQKRGYKDNKATNALHSFRGPIQIIEAERDERVPHQTVQNYLDAVADKDQLSYTVLKDAPHSLVNETLRAEYNQLLSVWVTNLDI